MSTERRWHRLRHFAREEVGVVAVVVGLLMVVLVIFAALGIDVASLYAQQRDLQAKADLAAVSGAGHLPDPLATAQATLEGNGLSDGSLKTLSYGIYAPVSTMAIAARFAASTQTDPRTNGVSVVLNRSAPLYFARILTQSDSITLSATAKAARLKAASFTLGSRLLQLDGGVLNDLLSAALGTQVNLSVMDYQSLANANVDFLTFSKALGTRAGLTIDNFNDFLDGNVTYGNVVGALLDSVGVSDAQQPLTTLLNGVGSSTLGINQLINPQGDALGLRIEDVFPPIQVSALDMLTAAADIVTAQRQVTLGVTAAVPGVLNASANLLLGEPAINSGYVTIGSPGATVHTAQTRLMVTANLDPTLLSLGTGVTPVSVRLPLYLEIAAATASLSMINCGVTDPSATVATFATGFDGIDDGAQTGTHLLDLYLGTFNPALFTNTSAPLSVSSLGYADLLKVNLLGLQLITIQAKSFVAVGQATTTSTAFTLSDMQGHVIKTVTSGDLLSSAVGTLLQNTQLQVSPGTVLGFLVAPLVNPLLAILPTILNTALLTPVDSLIDGLLKTLGIGVGQADLTLDGVTCDTVRLVR
ncbi:MAG: hypothetical protein GC186_16610 [Rhodobacteraceae bacterium]|nr:hypothetical protein [Paracoccaceae bacterium]